MLILAIDTCGFFYSIALIKDNILIEEIRSDKKNMQCEELVSKIESILKNNSLSYDNLALIGVTSGPGTFNGVRIGMSAAYGISLAKDIKIATVSTLEVMAYKTKANSVCFTVDADTGFLQKFDMDYAPTSDIVEVFLNDLTDPDTIIFDANTYDISELSNGAITGILASRSKNNAILCYGKQPSIHTKK